MFMGEFGLNCQGQTERRLELEWNELKIGSNWDWKWTETEFQAKNISVHLDLEEF